MRISSSDVGAHGQLACGERPNVEVVDLFDLLNVEHVLEAGDYVDCLGGRLHEHTDAVLEDGTGRENAKHGEDHGADGISDSSLRVEIDDDSSNDNTDGLHDVTDDVDNSSADVHVLVIVTMPMSVAVTVATEKSVRVPVVVAMIVTMIVMVVMIVTVFMFMIVLAASFLLVTGALVLGGLGTGWNQ